MVQSLCLGFNGISEAFAYSRAESQSRLRNSMLLNSIIYIVACYYFCVLFGVRGLMFAKSLSMLLRGFRSLQLAGVAPVQLVASSIGSKVYLGLVAVGSLANLAILFIIK